MIMTMSNTITINLTDNLRKRLVEALADTLEGIVEDAGHHLVGNEYPMDNVELNLIDEEIIGVLKDAVAAIERRDALAVAVNVGVPV